MTKDKTPETSKVNPTHSEANLELFENPDALQNQIGKSEAFVRKNSNVLYIILGVIVLGAVGFWYFQQEKAKKAAKVQQELFPALFYAEKDSLGKAMEGDGNNTSGFVKIADEYGGTPGGNLATLYAGYGYLRQGKNDEAIKYLKDFSADDMLMQARAYSLIGDAYMEKKEYGSAVEYYQKAADYKPNPQFTPHYLLKLMLAQELNGKLADAVATCDKFLTTYPSYTDIGGIKRSKARLEHMNGKKD
ncbi:MAG: tetratricopeptide repeat protein [Cytophagales bacterium]|nr:MAG: tetratricopeptide repeat protein [Cytophagales bacterium]TAF60260.1 MAG: tetratricopeptide repeat protein [Cytophagales bacterium]